MKKLKGDSELFEISRNKMREIGCKSKIDVISKLYGGSYTTSPTS
jgi:hypothetical protein